MAADLHKMPGGRARHAFEDEAGDGGKCRMGFVEVIEGVHRRRGIGVDHGFQMLGQAVDGAPMVVGEAFAQARGQLVLGAYLLQQAVVFA